MHTNEVDGEQGGNFDDDLGTSTYSTCMQYGRCKLGGKVNSRFEIENMPHCMRCATTIRENSGAHTAQPHNTNKHGDRKCKQETTQERRRPCGSLG
jgi:hypothetical protein